MLKLKTVLNGKLLHFAVSDMAAKFFHPQRSKLHAAAACQSYSVLQVLGWFCAARH